MKRLALDCSDLRKEFPRSNSRKLKRFFRRERFPAVDDVSFSIKEGEIFGVIGPNGSGKSTLIRLISTLLLPDEGEISVFGLDVIKDSKEVRKIINRVTVEASFFKKLSAMENLSYSARLYNVPMKTAKKRIAEIMKKLDFPLNRMKEPLENLSRGMQQKVAITRALFTDPTLILLDEPTTGLDPRSKRQVQSFIMEVRKHFNATILLTTHDMEEVELICDRIAIINEGRFVALNTFEGLQEDAGNGTGSISMEEIFLKLTGEKWEEVK